MESSGNTALVLLLLCLLARGKGANRRRSANFRERLDVNEYIARNKDNNTDTLTREMRMEAASFQKLAGILRDGLQHDERMGALRGGAVTPELCIFCTLRYLAGASYLDIMRSAGISQTKLYDAIWLTIDVLIASRDRELDNIHFPKTEEECRAAAAGFASISYNQAIINCVSVFDGYLVEIETPSTKDVGNVRSYYSGHYQCHGVNVQASCDSDCRFTYIALAGPGVMADREAIRRCKLGKLIASLPSPYVAIGDAAYTACEQLAAIFFGNAGKQVRYDNFNYFASQLRIRIEMAFGMMQGKWAILEKPLKVPITKVWKLVVAIARLHNFCINERIGETPTRRPRLNPSTPQAADGTPIRQEDGSVYSQLRPSFLRGESATRERMVQRVEDLGLVRPRTSSRRREPATNVAEV
jgi:DDE superfamily endonuclease